MQNKWCTWSKLMSWTIWSKKPRDAAESVIPYILTRVWQELEYWLNMCGVTKGSHIELTSYTSKLPLVCLAFYVCFMFPAYTMKKQYRFKTTQSINIHTVLSEICKQF
jgi:hypothetical protein